MLFNSFDFIWLFPLVFIAYSICIGAEKEGRGKPRIGNAFLILVSYGLYVKWKPVYALVLLWVTFITFISAKLIYQRRKTENGSKFIFVWALFLTFFPLFLFKYFNFINSVFSNCLGRFGITTGLPGLNWAMPLGLSFYTLQAVGYLCDVYQLKIDAEGNWWDYMLFVSFFPQIASGPISRAKDLLPQIKSERQFDYPMIVDGLRLLLWGMFLKVVMADRIGIIVNTLFDNYQFQGGYTLLFGSFLYAFQIYGDFAGYSFMAVGVGKILGFNLINNFRRPYLAQSVSEFWHRWHISLSTWLRDYIYIPLGGSRCSKARNYLNIFITFIISGIWHGANWTYLIWGMIHGAFQVFEKAIGLHKKESFGITRLVRIIVTFVTVSFAWIFFRMPTVSDAVSVLFRILSESTFVSSPISMTMWLFVFISLTIVAVKDITDEVLPRNFQLLTHQNPVIRWSVYLVLLCLILSCGVFDASQFIYVSF